MRERETLALAAADRPQGGERVDAGEAEPGQHGLRPLVGVPDIGQGRLGEQLVEATARLRGGIATAGAEGLPRLGELPFETARAVQGVGDDGCQGRLGSEGQLLVEHAEGAGGRYRAAVGCEVAGQHAEQRGLAAAVLAEQAGGPAGGHHEAHVREDAAVGEREGDPVGPQMQGGVAGAGRGSGERRGVQG